jgi:hypothetical protein
MQTRSIKETIQSRQSCRSYVKANIDKTVAGKLNEFIKKNSQCLFHSNHRFVTVHGSNKPTDKSPVKPASPGGTTGSVQGVHFS